MADIGTFLAAISSIGFDRGATDDDGVDRLNHMVMYGVLIVMAAATAAKQYVGEPIFCWVPAEYHEKFYKRYANNYCWVHPLYNIFMEDPVPPAEDERYFNDVSFYRWVTVWFVVMAVMFRVPNLLWKEAKKFSGANLEKLVGMTLETSMMEQEERDKQLGHVAEFLHRWLTTRYIPYRKGRLGSVRNKVENTVLCFGKRSGHFLIGCYLFIKAIYLANVIFQFFFISWFIKSNFWSFGTDAMSMYFENGAWEDHYIFPRVALCDFKIRQMTNVLTFTVQCVLSINLFLEKIFLLVWFCLIFMFIANAVSFIKWIYQLIITAKTTEFLMKYSGVLVPELSTSAQDKKEFRKMARTYLKPDGVFLVRMISVNTTELLVIDLLRHIWARYKKHRDEDPKKSIPDDVRENGDVGSPHSSEV